jgi:tripartite-type tricarboxylate transporter receptor subunit TctC
MSPFDRFIARCSLAAGALLAALAPAAATAQEYPAKSIRWIVPYPPGGTSDFVTRLIGQKLSDAWKQPVLVDNRGGANGNIGTEMAAKAPPDGYTLLLVANALTINQGLYRNLTSMRREISRR